MEKELIELHAIVHGHVQGVFFRAVTRDYAQRLGIAGTVQNLPDGTVKIVAQGPREEVDRLLEMLQSETGPGSVNSIDKVYRDLTQGFSDFRITY